MSHEIEKIDEKEPTGKKRNKEELLYPLEVLKEKFEVKEWEYAGLCRYKNWKEGKSVSESDFSESLNQFRKKKTGGRLK